METKRYFKDVAYQLPRAPSVLLEAAVLISADSASLLLVKS